MRLPIKLVTAAVFGAVMFLSWGCGGGGTSFTTTPAGASGTSLHVNLGDAPVDRIVDFEITVTSIVLTDSNGGTVSVLSSPTRIELTHLSGTVEPLSLMKVPPGTYTKATIMVSNPELEFVNDAGQVVEAAVTLTTGTATVNFSPALTIGSTPAALNFDFDLAASVTIDTTNNTATVTPTFTASTAPVAAENEQEDDNGEMEDLTGTVTDVSPPSFTISVQQSSQSLAFLTDSNTQFEGIAGVSALTNGMIVQVDAVTQADGSLLAKKVEVEENNGMELEGLVTSVTGAPVTQFQIVLQDEQSSGSMPTLGSTITVNVADSTNFRFENDAVDLSNLAFTPTFDRNTLGKAQRVEVDATSPGSGTTVDADKVKLELQALSGTVSATSSSGGQTTFTLTVAPDSAFALLTGSTTLTAIQQPGTELKGISSVFDGEAVRVRGLLFFNGTNYNLVAKRVSAP